jgi:hypothetical protein
MIKARFYVSKVVKQNHGGTENTTTVELQAAIAGEKNQDWAKWTPSGKIEMTVTNPFAEAWFDERVGKVVALTFNDVDE